MSAQTKMRAWIAQMPSGHEFTTGDARAFLEKEGFNPDQSGSLLHYMIVWWHLIERTSFGKYKRKDRNK